MTGTNSPDWQRMFLVFRPLLEVAVRHEDVLDVRPAIGLSQLHRELQLLYQGNPALGRVLVRVDGVDIGVTTRALVEREPGHYGPDTPPVGANSGDGATLPGLPGEFRAVRYACGEPGCGRTMLRSFYDDRDLPECEEHPDTTAVYVPREKT